MNAKLTILFSLVILLCATMDAHVSINAYYSGADSHTTALYVWAYSAISLDNYVVNGIGMP